MNKTAVVPLMLCLAARLFGQPAMVAHASAACSAGCPGGAITTPAIDTTKASLIVLASADQGSGVGFQDNQRNVWKPLTRYVGVPGMQLAYCEPCMTSASHTFTNTSGVYPSFAVIAWSGTVASAALDGQNGIANAASPISTPITTTQNGEVVVTAIASQNYAADSIDSMFALIEHQAFLPGNHFGISLAWKLQPAAGAMAPKWTSTNGSTAAIAAFKAAPLPPRGGGYIASGTVALSTSAIPPRASDGSGGCSPLVPISAPGAKTLSYTPTTDMTTVAGYAPSSTDSSLYIIPVVGSIQGFRVCSNSSNPITPGPLSLNWAAF